VLIRGDLNTFEFIGDRSSFLRNNILESVESKRKQCLAATTVEVMGKRHGWKDTISEFYERIGRKPGPLSLDDLDHIEKVYSTVRPFRYIVFSAQMKLLRIGNPIPEAILRQKRGYDVSIVMSDKHVWKFRKPQVASNQLRRELSFYNLLGTSYKIKRSGEELFRLTQRLQPEQDKVQEVLNVSKKFLNSTTKNKHGFWVMREEKKQKAVRHMKQKGQYSNSDSLITSLPKRDTFSMSDSLVFDLETGSLTDCTFKVYNVSYRSQQGLKVVTAKHKSELNTILLTSLEDWIDIAESLPEKQLLCWSYFGCKFDNLFVLDQIIRDSKHRYPITDYLESNGKVMKFTYGPLVFRDLWLITQSSLRSACSSFAVNTAKGYFFHLFLQRCASDEVLMQRLNSVVDLNDMKKYISWYDDVTDPEILQKRYHGMAELDRLKEYSKVYQWFETVKNTPYDVKENN
jgi:hypothetical protein